MSKKHWQKLPHSLRFASCAFLLHLDCDTEFLSSVFAYTLFCIFTSVLIFLPKLFFFSQKIHEILLTRLRDWVPRQSPSETVFMWGASTANNQPHEQAAKPCSPSRHVLKNKTRQTARKERHRSGGARKILTLTL